MKFGLKNDDGIELVLSPEERKLIFNALRHYSAYGPEKDVTAQMGDICVIMNVLHTPEFDITT